MNNDLKQKLEQCKKELEECKIEKEQNLEGWQRAKADFMNLRGKQEEEIKKTKEKTKSDTVEQLLPIFDNLERAKKQVPSKQKNLQWVKGIFHIKDQFEKFLENEGIEEIDPEGQDFDPSFHEAVAQVESKKKSGAVVEVFQKGYLYGNRLIRPARVKVVK